MVSESRSWVLDVLGKVLISCSLAARERSDCRQGGPPGATLAGGVGARSPLGAHQLM